MMKKLLTAALLMPLIGFSQVINENFDGTFPPAGWSLETTDAAFTWYQETGFPINGTGTASVQYDDTLAAQDETLISPSVDLTGFTQASLNFTVSLSYFWAITPNNNYDAIVKVSTDGGFSYTNVWTEVDLGVFESYIPYLVTVDLSAYAGNADVKVAFQYIGMDGAQLLIDDVSLTTCTPPSAITSSGTSDNSTTISWTGAAATYDIEYGPAGFTAGTGTTFSGVTAPYTLSGLTSCAGYDVYVRAVCSGTSTSLWIGPYYFSTNPGAPASVPFTENFEGAISPSLPPCTSSQNVGTGNDWVTGFGLDAYGFESTALVYVYNVDNAANTWFFTRGVNLTAGQSYTLTYRYGNSGGTTYPENLRVSYGLEATALGMTSQLADHPGIAVTDATAITNTVLFTPATTDTYYFGFNAYSDADEFYLIVDDINVSESLATTQFDQSAFSYFPNPVKNVLSLSGKNISTVEVFNILGQQMIINNAAASSQKQIDMSALSAGNYIVKVKEGDVTQVIKVIKE